MSPAATCSLLLLLISISISIIIISSSRPVRCLSGDEQLLASDLLDPPAGQLQLNESLVDYSSLNFFDDFAELAADSTIGEPVEPPVDLGVERQLSRRQALDELAEAAYRPALEALAEPLRAPAASGAGGRTGGGQKVGPQFTREPPAFIHYLNSSDLVIPCAASGSPAPTIVSSGAVWWSPGAGHLLSFQWGVGRDKFSAELVDRSDTFSKFKASSPRARSPESL